MLVQGGNLPLADWRFAAPRGIKLRLNGSVWVCFERIGPYDFTRGDAIAASIIISFMIASRRVAAIYALFALTMLIVGIALGLLFLVGLGIWLAVWLFVLAPGLRSRKRSKDIYLEYSFEGIIGETPQTRTTYKWATIGTVKKVGSRLFIMVSDSVALVVPERSTTPENIDRVVATFLRERLTTNL